MEEYYLSRINLVARKKGQLCICDLSNVMNWVGYNTHTHTQHRDTPTHSHTQGHTNKVKKARNIRDKNNGRLEELSIFFKKN